MKCYYHNDIDGRCAGSVVAQFENNYNPNNFFEVDYTIDLPIESIAEGETVYLVDYSFKENTLWQLEAIMKKTTNVIWIDHHTSSLELLKTHPELTSLQGLREDGISGAALTYMYLYDVDALDKCPAYIQYVSDYDCWKFTLDPATTLFKLGVEARSYDALDIVWDNLLGEYEESQTDEYMYLGTLDSICTDGAIIKQYIDTDNDYYRSHFAYETEIAGYKCMVVNKKSNSWVFGKYYDEYPLVMTWVFNGSKYNYSIFSSNPNVDCSKIAESYGGGGHKGAAGFVSDKLLFKGKEGV